jgi:hypothetical protein
MGWVKSRGLERLFTGFDMDNQSSTVFAVFSLRNPKTFAALVALQDCFGYEVATSAARVIQLIASRRISETPFAFSEETMDLLEQNPEVFERLREAAFTFIQEEAMIKEPKNCVHESSSP